MMAFLGTFVIYYQKHKIHHHWQGALETRRSSRKVTKCMKWFRVVTNQVVNVKWDHALYSTK